MRSGAPGSSAGWCGRGAPGPPTPRDSRPLAYVLSHCVPATRAQWRSHRPHVPEMPDGTVVNEGPMPRTSQPNILPRREPPAPERRLWIGAFDCRGRARSSRWAVIPAGTGNPRCRPDPGCGEGEQFVNRPLVVCVLAVLRRENPAVGPIRKSAGRPRWSSPLPAAPRGYGGRIKARAAASHACGFMTDLRWDSTPNSA